MLSGSRLYPIPNLRDPFTMNQNISNLRIRGDLPGYVSEGPVVVTNAAGHPMDPQPAAHTLAVTFTGLANAYLSQDGRVVIVGDDNGAPGAAWEMRVSAIETGDQDDLVLAGVYDPDQVGTVEGGSTGNLVAAASAAELPAPASAPEA